MNTNEPKKKKIKLKLRFKILLFIIFIIIYAFFIGTKGINIKEYQIKTNKIDKLSDGFNIIQFSDLHFGSTMKINDIKKIVSKINNTKPDIVIFTGDLINQKYDITKKEIEQITKELANINAELGKYYITGEEDSNDSLDILNNSNFINIENTTEHIYKNSTTPIILGGKKAITKYLKENKDINLFTILALHNPNGIDKLTDYKIDMTIAGHTHNGQINIPKLKELFIDSKHIKAYEKLSNTKLYINPGLGTSTINARLFNKPKIYLYRINQTSK